MNNRDNILDKISPDSTGIKPESSNVQGITTRVVKGSFWTLVGQILPMAVSFVLLPFIIRLFGTEKYGLYAFIIAFPLYFTFADAGMSLASTRFAAEAYSENSEEAEAEAVCTSAVIGIISSSILAAFLIIGSPFIVSNLLNVSEDLHSEAIVAVCLMALTIIVRVLCTIFNTPLLVRLRMDLNSFVNTLVAVLQTISITSVLYFGGGIIEVFSLILIFGVLNVIGLFFVSGKLLKPLYSFRIDPKKIRPLLNFGGAVMLSMIAATLLVNIEKIVLTKAASVTAFAHYSVAFTLTNMVVVFSSAMVQSLIPAFAQLHAANKIEEIKSLYSRMIRLNLLVVVPIAVLLCIIAKPFFTIWAGEEFGRESILPFYILVGGLIFNVVAYIPSSLLNAAKFTKTIALLYWLELVPYVFLTIILTYKFGAVGAALAWSLRVLIDTLVFIYLSKKKIAQNLTIFSLGDRNLFLSLALLAVPLLSLFIFDNVYISLVLALIFVSGYGLLVWNKIILSEEKNWIQNRVKNLMSNLL